jgi:Ca-activated chloride channel family protein
MVIALVTGLAASLLAFAAERRHARRTARVARLAFGPSGAPARWARAAPAVRTAGMGLAAFGAVVLARWDPAAHRAEPNPRAARQLLVVLDVSPSMNLTDAGPGIPKQMRGVWAGKVLRGVLDRLDMADTRVTLVAFYSKAAVMLRSSDDKDLVAGLMDGLPLYTAFKPGETDMQSALDKAFDIARPWARGSTTLVVISDGDLAKPVNPGRRPASIADAIVIGVGDPGRPTVLAGHASRQDAWTLKALAGRLDGLYHDGNVRHLPSDVLDRLTSIAPRTASGVGERELGLASLAAGAMMLGALAPALVRFGAPEAWHVQPGARRRRTEHPEGRFA